MNDSPECLMVVTLHSEQPPSRIATTSWRAELEMRCLCPSQRGWPTRVEDHPRPTPGQSERPEKLARSGADPDQIHTRVRVGAVYYPDTGLNGHRG